MYVEPVTPPSRPVTVPSLRAMKRRAEKIVALTAYDYSFAALCEAAGVDVVLVGDSLGMVVQGHATTLPVTMDDMVYHTRCVARGLRRTLLVADIPFLADASVDTVVCNGGRLLAQGGASMVKLEGAGIRLPMIQALVAHGIPVCAHLGLTPQSVHQLGGFRKQGKTPAAAEQLQADARAVQDAGAQALVLESVPGELARAISQELDIAVIGIGAGAGCDGQILVGHDIIGLTPGHRPPFSRDFLKGHDSLAAAVAAYAVAVRTGAFPE